MTTVNKINMLAPGNRNRTATSAVIEVIRGFAPRVGDNFTIRNIRDNIDGLLPYSIHTTLAKLSKDGFLEKVDRGVYKVTRSFEEKRFHPTRRQRRARVVLGSSTQDRARRFILKFLEQYGVINHIVVSENFTRTVARNTILAMRMRGEIMHHGRKGNYVRGPNFPAPESSKPAAAAAAIAQPIINGYSASVSLKPSSPRAIQANGGSTIPSDFSEWFTDYLEDFKERVLERVQAEVSMLETSQGKFLDDASDSELIAELNRRHQARKLAGDAAN